MFNKSEYVRKNLELIEDINKRLKEQSSRVKILNFLSMIVVATIFFSIGFSISMLIFAPHWGYAVGLIYHGLLFAFFIHAEKKFKGLKEKGINDLLKVRSLIYDEIDTVYRRRG